MDKANQLQAVVEIKISAPIKTVFDSIVRPEKLSCYFTSKSSGILESGKTVIWTWSDVYVELPIKVNEVNERNEGNEVKGNQSISFAWSASGVETQVEIVLQPTTVLSTYIKVIESAWENDAIGIKRYGEQTKGWMHMLCCMKAFLEY